MRILHTGDLHLGKRPFSFDLYDDQQDMLEQLLVYAQDADVTVLAGDLYHRSEPAPKVITQLGRFLERLAALGKPVLIVRGNHDGEAMLSYAAPLLRKSNIYISDVFDGKPERVRLSDGLGPVDFTLLPYIKPAQARHFYPGAKIESYEGAVRTVLAALPPDPTVRNVLVTHQFIAGATVSDASEERVVGTLDSIGTEAFEGYDYIALGHLHTPQGLQGGRFRYSGSPLCYAFEECDKPKSVTLATLTDRLSIEELPVKPLHAMECIEGTLEEICAGNPSEAYTFVTLTDEKTPLDAAAAIRTVRPNCMRVARRGLENPEILLEIKDVQAQSLQEHFIEFYRSQTNGRDPSAAQMAMLQEFLEQYERSGDA